MEEGVSSLNGNTCGSLSNNTGLSLYLFYHSSYKVSLHSSTLSYKSSSLLQKLVDGNTWGSSTQVSFTRTWNNITYTISSINKLLNNSRSTYWTKLQHWNLVSLNVHKPCSVEGLLMPGICTHLSSLQLKGKDITECLCVMLSVLQAADPSQS